MNRFVITGTKRAKGTERVEIKIASKRTFTTQHNRTEITLGA